MCGDVSLRLYQERSSIVESSPNSLRLARGLHEAQRPSFEEIPSPVLRTEGLEPFLKIRLHCIHRLADNPPRDPIAARSTTELAMEVGPRLVYIPPGRDGQSNVDADSSDENPAIPPILAEFKQDTAHFASPNEYVVRPLEPNCVDSLRLESAGDGNGDGGAQAQHLRQGSPDRPEQRDENVATESGQERTPSPSTPRVLHLGQAGARRGRLAVPSGVEQELIRRICLEEHVQGSQCPAGTRAEPRENRFAVEQFERPIKAHSSIGKEFHRQTARAKLHDIPKERLDARTQLPSERLERKEAPVREPAQKYVSARRRHATGQGLELATPGRLAFTKVRRRFQRWRRRCARALSRYRDKGKIFLTLPLFAGGGKCASLFG